MCGIAGIVRFQHTSVEEKRLHVMMRKMKYRGPNDEGTFVQDNIGLGFVRLSILDLSSAGHQPMFDEAHRYVIVFNGEIYNYIELREELKENGMRFHTNTDTEVLLKSYIYYGEDCLHKLNGMFSFVIYDTQTKKIFGARDRFGVKPFYYYRSQDEFIFASEIPSILAVYKQKNAINSSAVFDYLVFNRTDQTEQTFFKDIYKLQHGHCFTIENGALNIRQWYNLREIVENKKVKATPEDYLELLVDAVKLRLRSDVPVGVCLSGGLDSSSIASVLESILDKKDVNTFSAVYGKGVKADESRFIDLYKDKLSNMFEVRPSVTSLLEDMDRFIQLHAEPLPSTGPYAQYCVMRLAQQRVTVTLDGQGADEELAGYHYFYGLYYKSLLKRGKIFSLLRELVAYAYLHRSLYAIKTFIFFLLPSKLRTKTRVKERGYLLKEFVDQHNQSVIADSLYASRSVQDALINHFEYKLEHLLKWNDRNSMAFSIESRTPFLDYRLVEYTLASQDEAKIHNGYTKSILRTALRGILPEPIRKRRDKKGFATPQDDWFRDERFQTKIMDILTSTSLVERKIIDHNLAIDLYQKHCRGEINIAKDIWKWINFELWCRTYIDNSI